MQVRQLPVGWDVHAMAHTKGRLFAQPIIEDPAAFLTFQTLLDRTLRPVYTRDRRGELVPKQLELLAVYEVQNDAVRNRLLAIVLFLRRGTF